MIFTLYALLVATAALGAPMASLDADTFLQNGKDAQVLNAEFASLNASDSCTTGDLACMGTSIAQCVNGTWQTEDCPKSLFCFALPSVREEGSVLSCTTNATALAVINASGATGGLFANSTKDSVDFPTDCGDDDDNDGSDTQSSTTTASATSTQTNVDEGSATQTASASASFSTVTGTAISSPISTTGTNDTADATITVTVTAPAAASTQFSETTVLDPAQASSFLSSIATDTNFSIVTTILPTSTSGVTATTTAASSSGEAQSSAFSSKPVGIASKPAGSSTSNTGAPTTITLVPRPSSASQSVTAQATAASDSSYY